MKKILAILSAVTFTFCLFGLIYYDDLKIEFSGVDILFIIVGIISLLLFVFLLVQFRTEGADLFSKYLGFSILLIIVLSIIFPIGFSIYKKHTGYQTKKDKIKSSKSLNRNLPKLFEEGFEDESHNILEIKAIKDNILTIDGKEDSLQNLKSIVKQFILKTSDKIKIDLLIISEQYKSKGIVVIEYIDDSSFDLYLQLQDSLVSVFNEIRNDYSLKFFNEAFDKLETNKSELIIDLVPLSITEAIPKIKVNNTN